MKRFYVIFFAGFILLSVLLYLSTWWFLGGVGIIFLVTAYHFYNSRLKTLYATIEELESQVEGLQKHLDRSLLKEETATTAARQITQMKKDLLTAINHEIRTPMNGVLGMSLLLADTKLTDEQKGYIDVIKNSGQNLLNTVNDILVNDILEYSKLDQKNKKLQVIDFNLRDTLEEVIAMFAVKAAGKRLELLNDIDDQVPLQLSGDNKRLREVLMNLIENAVKFTQNGQVLVRVQSLSRSGYQPVICIEVEDSGIGVADEKIKHIFYPTPSRGFDSDTKKSGRGLVICRKHVELMKGKIEVKSRPGSGSTFIITLPFDHSQGLRICSDVETGNDRLEEQKVLVVDDNTVSRNIIVKQLKAWKMITAGADSGLQALEILAKNNLFDLVLVNLAMADMGGLHFARTIKNLYPHLELLLLNPYGNELYKQDQDLFAAIITKPLRQHIFQDQLIALFTKENAERKTRPAEMETEFSKKYPLHILVAEDNIINQKIAVKILNRLGYQPRLAVNGREAFEMTGQQPCDIILMDVQMPEMDGLEATKMIRTELPVQPVIVAMTANVLQGDRDACLQAGMDDYISKPVILEELLRQLEKWSLVINERKKTNAVRSTGTDGI